MINSAGAFYYHVDGLGSVVAISDSNKTIVARYAYDSFGRLSSTAPDFENAYAFTGREWDREIGLYYYRARYYDAMEGRFISVDPLSFAAGDMNVYRYVGNNSNNFIDPLGLFFWYGHYGGPDFTSGQEMSWDQLSQGTILLQPVDSQDWAYFKHDQSYGICRSTTSKENQWKGFTKADGKLLGDLMRLPLSPSNWDEPPMAGVGSNVQRFMAITIFTLKITGESFINAIPEAYRNFRKTLSGEPIY